MDTGIRLPETGGRIQRHVSRGGAVMLYVTLYLVALGLCGFGFCAGLLMIANTVD